MIQFQEDADERSSGTGSFDLSAATRIVDPPPRDYGYFLNHLTFVQNYFRKVSGGRRIIVPTLLNTPYRLSQKMQFYSPGHGSTTNTELGTMMKEAWHIVDSANPGLSFSSYDAFILFHAGAGRDIDFVSLYGFDPYPFDIPSIFVNLQSLRKMFEDSYDGIPVQNGAFKITNTMIIPETENHQLSSVGGPSLLQLGINGLLAASFGSFYGLPDLFDTKTGASGIGRFGLMDGQSIFSWNGIFPPSPSAWERYALGWTDPVVVSANDAVYSFPATGISDIVYKVLISAKEYFLLENRNRDAHNDGSIIKLARNGFIVTRTFPRDTSGFNAFFQDSLYGVVTDVDEFDWSLPGGVDSRTYELYTGGILIWHIDENVIDANISTDAVNANPDYKGVNLMEADGSQDIGQTYGFLEPGSGSENGTALDYWYAGNQAPLRVKSNVFSPTSFPSSRSNLQANSHITVKDFSAKGPSMTARIQVGDAQLYPLSGFPKNVQQQFGKNSICVGTAPGVSQGLFVATDVYGPLKTPLVGTPSRTFGPSRVFGWNPDGGLILPSGDSSGLLVIAYSFGPGNPKFYGKPITGISGSTPSLAIGGPGTRGFSALAWSFADFNNDKLLDPLISFPVGTITTSPAAADSVTAFGGASGVIYFVRNDGSSIDSIRLSATDFSDIVGVSLFAQPNVFVAVSGNGTIGLVSPTMGAFKTMPLGRAMNSPAAVGLISSSVGKRIAVNSQDGFVYLLDSNLSVAQNFPVSSGGDIEGSPAIADVDGDGQRDVVVFSSQKIFAINAAGALIDNFPLDVQKNLTTSPIVADVDGNGTVDIIGVTSDGLVVAYDHTGRMASGFPLQAGPNSSSTPAVFTFTTAGCNNCSVSTGLAVASDDGFVYAWRTSLYLASSILPDKFRSTRLPWPQLMHDALNTGLDEGATSPTTLSEFFPESRAYNWPNPVRKEDLFKTHIRYFVRDDAKVHVKIFDMAGDLVTEFDGPGQGGLDNEVVWDVSGIQSGVYFARIGADGTNGSGHAVIKIAVIK